MLFSVHANFSLRGVCPQLTGVVTCTYLSYLTRVQDQDHLAC